MSAPLLATKLYRPPVRPNGMPRPRLTARLNESRPLTLISAPAGFGKTTLVSEWISAPHLTGFGNPSGVARVAWLSLDADDLRFTPDEAAAFLNQAMGLELSAEDIATLETRTEGWVAGLQRAALSMQGRDDVSGFVRAFSGSHRHILSYLVEEVLSRQPADTLDFLLRTSTLDRLCGPLCDAVMGWKAGEQASGGAGETRNEPQPPSSPAPLLNSQTVLEKLEHGNLFITPLDDRGQWYRYHQLFADALRARLKRAAPTLLPDLHRRASEWFEQNEFIDEAVRHALAATDTERAGFSIWPTVILHVATHTIRLVAIPEPDSMTILVAWLVLQIGMPFLIWAFRGNLLKSGCNGMGPLAARMN